MNRPQESKHEFRSKVTLINASKALANIIANKFVNEFCTTKMEFVGK